MNKFTSARTLWPLLIEAFANADRREKMPPFFRAMLARITIGDVMSDGR